MNTFADYILEEKDLACKMEITYYLSKKTKIFFDKSIIFKTEIARMFIDYMKIEVDRNLVLTACLLCNCKKIDNAQNLEQVHLYAKMEQNIYQHRFDKNFAKFVRKLIDIVIVIQEKKKVMF